MYETLEHVFRIVVQYGILALEIVAVAIIFITAVRALLCIHKEPGESRKQFSGGIVMALSFLLGSEVLRTIIAPDWREIGMTCAILLTRAAVVVLIHWEGKNEE